MHRGISQASQRGRVVNDPETLDQHRQRHHDLLTGRQGPQLPAQSWAKESRGRARGDKLCAHRALEQSQPIYGRQETTQRVGDVKTRVEQDVIIGYNTYETHTPVQETLENPAHVGMSVRLVDVETGEMLWSGSASGHASQTHEAAEVAAAEFMKAVAARLKEFRKSGNGG